MTMLEKGLREATYYEEKLIHSLWYFRTNPNSEAFFPMNEFQLARKIAAQSFEPRTIERTETGELIA